MAGILTVDELRRSANLPRPVAITESVEGVKHEPWITDTPCPDFRRPERFRAVADPQWRERRFGRLA